MAVVVFFSSCYSRVTMLLLLLLLVLRVIETEIKYSIHQYAKKNKEKKCIPLLNLFLQHINMNNAFTMVHNSYTLQDYSIFVIQTVCMSIYVTYNSSQQYNSAHHFFFQSYKMSHFATCVFKYFLKRQIVWLSYMFPTSTLYIYFKACISTTKRRKKKTILQIETFTVDITSYIIHKYFILKPSFCIIQMKMFLTERK